MSEIQRTPKDGTDVKKTPKRIETTDGSMQKKPFWKRLKEAMFMETVKSVGNYLWKDIFIPSIKKLLDDSGSNAIHMMLYGDTKPNYPGRTHVENASVYSGRAVGHREPYYNRTNRYQSILEGNLFTYRETAYGIIHEAMDWIHEYGFISVEVFNQILPPQLAFETVHTDADWGWYELNDNCVVQVPGGWTIDLPPAKPRR